VHTLIGALPVFRIRMRVGALRILLTRPIETIELLGFVFA
jgi:hypothetical protein